MSTAIVDSPIKPGVLFANSLHASPLGSVELSTTIAEMFWLLGRLSTWRCPVERPGPSAEPSDLPRRVGPDWVLAHAYDKGRLKQCNSEAELDMLLQQFVKLLARLMAWSYAQLTPATAGQPDGATLDVTLAPEALDGRITAAVDAAVAALPKHTELDPETLKAMVAQVVADMPPPVAVLPDDLSTTIARLVAGLPEQFAAMPPNFRQIVADAVALLPRPTIHLPADFTDRVRGIVDTKLADIRKELALLKSHTHALYVEKKILEDKPFNRAVFWWSLLPFLVVGWIIAGFSQTDWGTGGRMFLARLIAGVLSGTCGLVFGKTVKTSVVTGVFVDGLPLAAEEAHNG